MKELDTLKQYFTEKIYIIDAVESKFNTIKEVIFALESEEIAGAMKETVYEDGCTQCYAFRNRSIIDIYQIVNTYIPGSEIGDIVRIIIDMNISGDEDLFLYPGYCGDIDKCVLFAYSKRQRMNNSDHPHPIEIWDYLHKFTGEDRFDNWGTYFEEAGITEQEFNSMFIQ